MNNENKITHEELVANLVKPGEDILRDMGPEQAHRLHMASALLGEVAELFQAAPDDKENAKEEIGDCLFYLEGLDQILPTVRSAYAIHCDEWNAKGWWVSHFNQYVVTPRQEIARILGTLAARAGDVYDTVKREAFYCKELDLSKLQSAMLGTYHTLHLLAQRFAKCDLEECRQANVEKLTKRYKSGKYSNEQANARADKGVQSNPHPLQDTQFDQ